VKDISSMFIIFVWNALSSRGQNFFGVSRRRVIKITF